MKSKLFLFILASILSSVSSVNACSTIPPIPVLHSYLDYVVCDGYGAGFWGEVSYDPDGSGTEGVDNRGIEFFIWNFGDGDIYIESDDGQDQDGSLPFDGIVDGRATHLYEAPGYYTVTFQVIDFDETPSIVETVTVRILENPSIDNLAPAYTPYTYTATLNGEVTDLGDSEDVSVRIYWGDNDGGDVYANWDNAQYVGDYVEETFSYNVSNLVPNTTYYYRCYAVNGCSSALADSTTSFTTSPSTTTHTLTIIENNCSVTKNPDVTEYYENSQVTLTATADTGYEFVEWSDGSSWTSTNNPVTITMDADKTITATCNLEQQYTLTLSSSVGGTISASGTSPYSEGETVTITATPNAGYKLDYWTGDFDSANGNEATVFMDGDKTIGVHFTPYTLTIDEINCTVLKTFNSTNGEYTLNVTPDDNYHWVGWNGDLSGTDNPYTVQINSDQRATALCKIDMFTLTDNASGANNGSVTISPDSNIGQTVKTYPYGSVVEFSATAADGFIFDSWMVNQVSKEANPLSIFMDSNKTVSTTFALKKELNLTVENAISSIPTGLTYYPEGKTVVISITPNVGYGNIQWTGSAIDNGYAVPNGNTCTVTMTDNTALNATCEKVVSNVIYVSPFGNNSDGLSWQTAFNKLQDALDIAVSGSQIWVAKGTYYPDEDSVDSDQTSGFEHTDNLASESFVLKDGVKVYGGFAGYEMIIDERKPSINLTILNGDIEQDDVEFMPEGNNSYHVVTAMAGSLLDGFTVQRGLADDESLVEVNGAGILCKKDTGTEAITIRNCHIAYNKSMQDGAGVYIQNDVPSIELINCILDGNWAVGNGAGLYLATESGSSTDITSVTLINCTIHANKAIGSGGGLYSALETAEDTLTCTNCIFWTNIDGAGSQDESAQIDNQGSVVPVITYCCIDELTAYTGYNNISTDPTFIQNGQWKWYLSDGTEVDDDETNPTKLTVEGEDELFFYDLKVNVADMGAGSDGRWTPDSFIDTTLHTETTGEYAYAYKTPKFIGGNSTVSNEDSFDLWFTNDGITASVKSPKVTKKITWDCTNAEKGVFTFNNEHFFPLDGAGLLKSDGSGELLDEISCGSYYVNNDDYDCDGSHNYYFTMVYHGKITYVPEQIFHFKSSDDLFVAIDNKIVVDRGGYYNYSDYTNLTTDGPSRTTIQLKNGDVTVYEYPQTYNQTCDENPYDITILSNYITPTTIDLNLEPYQTYDFDLFFAQRSTFESVLVVDRTPGNEEMVFKYIPGDYHILANCIDAGKNSAVPSDVIEDYDGNKRQMDDPYALCTNGETEPVVDIGAYEYIPEGYYLDVYAGEDKREQLEETFTKTISLLDAIVYATFKTEIFDDCVYEWTVVYPENDSTLTFSDNEIQNPDITVDLSAAQGIFDITDSVEYILKLLVTDPVGSSEDFVRVTVYKDDFYNDDFTQQKPQVKVDGPYVVEMSNLPLTIRGTISDDGEPYSGILSAGWELLNSSGGQVEFSPLTYNANEEHRDQSGKVFMEVFSQVSFTRPGLYKIKLSASDGEKLQAGEELAHATTTIEVVQDNNPPVVEAGSAVTVTPDTYPYVLDLQDDVKPSVLDDGLLEQVKISWKQISGPINGMMYDPVDPLSKLTFTKTGSYILQLVADDGQFTITDQTTITLTAVPQVEAGQNKNGILATDGVEIIMADAWVKDNYPTPPNNNLSITWSVISQPVADSVDFDLNTAGIQTTYTSVSPADTDVSRNVKFLAVGDYQLQLSATDTDTSSPAGTITDTVSITVTASVPSTTKTALFAGGSSDSTGIGAVVYRRFPNDTSWERISNEGDLGQNVEGIISICEYNDEIYVGTQTTSSTEAQVRCLRNGIWENVSDNWGTDTVNRIYSLIEYKGYLYAGTNMDDHLYRYDGGTTWTKIENNTASTFSGIKCMYVWNDELYLGDFGYDKFAKYDGSQYTHLGSYGGSCVWDFEVFNSKLFASATFGYVYRFSDDLSWIKEAMVELTRTGSDDDEVWELEVFKGQLLISYADYLYYSLDGETYSKVEKNDQDWSRPNPVNISSDDIVSMLATEDYLIIGTGDEATHEKDPSLTGAAYKLNIVNGEVIEEYDISSGLDCAGVQCLLESDATRPRPDNFTIEITASRIEGGGCVSPLELDIDEVDYEITYNANGDTEAQNTMISVHLPDGVDFLSASNDGIYNIDDHYVLWYLGDLTSNASNETEPFYVYTKVNQESMPGGTLNALCAVESDNFFETVEIDTDDRPLVCCWADDIVYVSKIGSGHNGATWETAFNSLDFALTHIKNSVCKDQYSQIWVAGGDYTTNSTIELVEDIAIYGGFAGTEEQLYERDLSNENNHTKLIGTDKCNNVITADYTVNGNDDTILDGITVQGGITAGISCDGTSLTIQNCRISQNTGDGINCINASTAMPVIKNCFIMGNGGDGIELDSAGSETIRNNTILENGGYAINSGSAGQDVKLCLGWYNNFNGTTYDAQLNNCTVEQSCIQDIGTGTNLDVTDPKLDADGYHLAVDSPCIDYYDDSSTLWISESEIDIDGEKRKVGKIDIGADEYPPIRVNAGPDLTALLSIDTPSVDVFIEESSIFFTDQAKQNMGGFSLLWTQILLPSQTNTQTITNADSLYPTITFDSPGLYLFKVEAISTDNSLDVVMGADLLYIYIGLDMKLSYLPENVQIYDTVTMTAELPSNSGAAYIKWYGPEGVQFDGPTSDVSNDSATTELTFPAEVGNYQIKAYAFDDSGTVTGSYDEYDAYLGMKEIYVPLNSQQISINAGPDQTVDWPDNDIQLNGSVAGNVYDLNGNSLVRYEWRAPEGAEELVHFDDSTSLQTRVTFDTWGEFPLTLVMLDISTDEVYAYDHITVLVNSLDLGRIVVKAGNDQVLPWLGTATPVTAFLTGSVQDPTGLVENVRWVFNPDAASLLTIGNDLSPSTEVTFEDTSGGAVPGIYDFTLLAENNEGELLAHDTVQIKIAWDGIVVKAGDDQEVILGTEIELSGNIEGTGWSSVEWFVSSAPTQAVVSFDDEDSSDTTATLTSPGLYEIALLAKDSGGAILGSDILKIYVKRIDISAGPDQTITDYPNTSELALHGKIIEGSNVINGKPVKWQWRLPSGATGLASFTDDSSLDTVINFEDEGVPGVYIIELLAELETETPGTYEIIGRSTMAITVQRSYFGEDISADVSITANPREQMGTVAIVDIKGIINWHNLPLESIFYKWALPQDNSDDPQNPDYIADSGLVNSTVEEGTITFNKSGEYQVGLTAYYTDGTEDYMIGNCIIKFKVFVSGEESVKATVIVGTDPDFSYYNPYEIDLPVAASSIKLHAEIDSSLAPYYCEWIDPSNKLTFDNTSSTTPTITNSLSLTDAGKYEVALVVRSGSSTGEVVGFDVVTIHAYGTGYPRLNVDLGPDIDTILSSDGTAVVQLSGIIDASPGIWDKAEWFNNSQECISFSSDGFDYTTETNTFFTTATIEAPGVFPISLLIKKDDGNGGYNIIHSDTVIVTVSVPESFVDAEVAGKNGQDYADGEELQADTFTYLADTSLTLRANITGGIADSYEWIYNGDPDLVDITNPYGIETDVSFNWPGTYYIELRAKKDDQTVGSDFVRVDVGLPQITLMAGEHDGQDIQPKDEIIIPFNSTSASVNIAAQREGQDIANLNYTWSELQGRNVDFSQTFPIAAPETSVTATFYEVGEYHLEIEATDDQSNVYGYDTIAVIVVDGNPIVDAGTDYPAVAPDQPLCLNGNIWDDEAIIESNINWTLVSGATFDNRSIKNPTVTFASEGLYELTLEYTDGNNNYDSSSVYILVQIPSSYVFAGTDKTTMAGRFKELDDAFVTPEEQAVSYQWTSNAPEGVFVNFDPSANVLNPKVSISTPGTYYLELIVNDGQIPFQNGDKAKITVLANPIPDNEAPEVELNDKSLYTENADDYAYGIYTYTVEAADDQYLTDLYLILLNSSNDKCSEHLVLDEISVGSGTSESPKQLTYTYKLNIHDLPATGNPYTLKAYAFDGSGKSSIDSDSLTVSCFIHGFAIDRTPVIDNDPIEFSATIDDQSLDWYLQVLGESDIYTGQGDLVDYSQNNISNLEDGSYCAVLKLDVNDDGDVDDEVDEIAKVEFDIVRSIDLKENLLKAQLVKLVTDSETTFLQIPKSTGLEIPEWPVPVVKSGLFKLWGHACHSDGVEGISYKLELTNNNGFYRDLTPLNPKYVGSWNEDAEFCNIDMTSCKNGLYKLKLTVSCEGIGSVTDTVDFALDCSLKLGQVKFSQEDLVVPVGGYPLRIVRSYDSFNRDIDGDFGHGWDLSIANMDIEVVKSTDYNRDVVLTLPDGTRTTFTSYLKFYYKEDMFITRWDLHYDFPENLGISYFYAIDEDGDFCQEKLYDINHGEYGSGFLWYYDDKASVYDDLPYPFADIHDPAGFRLEMDDGTIFTIKRPATSQEIESVGEYGFLLSTYYRACGDPYLKSIGFPTGEFLEFTVEGRKEDGGFNDEEDMDISDKPVITGFDLKKDGSSLKSLKIVRDNNTGRITEIYPPSELVNGVVGSGSIPYVKYYYEDAYGNLTAIEKLVKKGSSEAESDYERTTFVYDDGVYSPSDHYVTNIQDPRGLSPIRYLYDNSGKLVGTMDAKGNVIEIQHNISGNTEIVTDRSNNSTIYQYNDRGNVVYMTNAQGVTSYAYGTVDVVYNDGTQDYAIETLSNSYMDSPSKIEYPDGSVVYNQYDSSGRILKTIDQELNITENVYLSDGNLKTSTQSYISDPAQPSSVTTVTTTENVYDEDKRLIVTGIKNHLGVWQNMTLSYYDDYNNLINSIQLNMDNISDFSNIFTETDGVGTLVLDAETNDHVVTKYVYNLTSSSYPGKPDRVIDPSGNTQHFVYDDNGNLSYSYHYWEDPAGVQSSKYIINSNKYDAQGRIYETRRIIDTDTDIDNGVNSNIPLNYTKYNSIGKVDFTIDFINDSKTQYYYDEVGNVVETRNYVLEFSDPSDKSDTTISSSMLITASRTLYDATNRTIVSVGPYACDEFGDPIESAVGSETVYDKMGRVTETRSWKNVEIVFSHWEASNGETIVSVPDGYDAENAIESIPYNLAWSSDGKIPLIAPHTSRTGSHIGPISYSKTIYDTAGRVKHSITLDENSKEQITTYDYDLAGKQIAVIDPPGHYIYDQPNGNNLGVEGIALTYDTVNVTKISFDNFDENTYDVDDFPNGNFTGTHINETFYTGTRRDSIVDALDNTTTFVYDDLGRVKETQHPLIDLDGDLNVDDATYTHVGYDALGRKEWQSNQTEVTRSTVESYLDTMTKQFRYDDGGRLIMVILPKPTTSGNNPIYRYYYDNYGNQTAILDPMGRATIFEYDHLNRQVVKYMPFEVTFSGSPDLSDEQNYSGLESEIYVLPSGLLFEQTFYDDLNGGRVWKSKDYKDQVAYYYYYGIQLETFDAENNLIGKPGQLCYKDSYLNDPYTNNTTIPDLSGVPEPDPDSRTYYTYDIHGRQDEVTFDDEDTDYNYDEQGRVIKVTSPQGIINYEYSGITGRKTATWTGADSASPGTKTEFVYDQMGRLDEVIVTYKDGSALTTAEETDYSYTDIGSRKSVTLPNGIYTEYSYNENNRLLGLTNYQSNTKSITLSRFAYTLAADGQRDAVSEYEGTTEVAAITYAYDNLNRLLSESYDDKTVADDDYSDTYTYDLASNRFSFDDGTNTVYYFYNSDGSLDAETSDAAGNNVLVQYSYDYNGSMTSKGSHSMTYNLQNRMETFSDGTTTWAYTYNPAGIRTSKDDGTTLTDYLIDSQNHTGYAQVLEEFNGTVTTTYTVGADIISQSTPTAIDYFLYDGHGSVRKLTNENAQIVTNQTYDYDAYGNRKDGNAADTNLQYCGEWRDAESGLDYLRARYYDPANGTFNRIDPFSGNTQDPESLNKYAYVHNNPVNATDPSGQFASLGGLSMSMSISAKIQWSYSKMVFRQGSRAQSRYLSSYSSYLANNMLKESNNATIIVHGITPQHYGYSSDFITELKSRAPNQDYFEYVWSGFAMDGVAPSKWAVNTTHNIATNGLTNVVKSIQAKGYRNVNIVSHSWGTVISRDVLSTGVGKINTWVTMGSPLPSHTQSPGNLGTWINIWNRHDWVATAAPYAMSLTGAGTSGSPLYNKRGIDQVELLGNWSFPESHGVYWTNGLSLNTIGNQLDIQH